MREYLPLSASEAAAADAEMRESLLSEGGANGKKNKRGFGGGGGNGDVEGGGGAPRTPSINPAWAEHRCVVTHRDRHDSFRLLLLTAAAVGCLPALVPGAGMHDLRRAVPRRSDWRLVTPVLLQAGLAARPDGADRHSLACWQPVDLI
jgi:hypothetical protein